MELDTFACFVSFLEQQEVLKIAAKILYYAVYGIIFQVYLKPYPHSNRRLIVLSVFTIFLEEGLHLLFDTGTIVIFNINNVILYLVGIAIGITIYKISGTISKKI